MGQLSDPWGPFVRFSYPLSRHWKRPLLYITLAWCRSSFGGASLSLRHVWKWPPVRHTLDIDLSGTAGPGLGGSGVEHCIVTTLVLPKVSCCAGRASCFAWKLWIKFLLSLVHFVHTVLRHKYLPYWLHVSPCMWSSLRTCPDDNRLWINSLIDEKSQVWIKKWDLIGQYCTSCAT